MNWLCSCCRKMKMEYQINIGVILIMVITMLLLAITFLVQITYLFEIVSGSAQIVFPKQEEVNLNNIAIFLQYYLNVKSQQYEARLFNINKLFNQYEKISQTYQNANNLEYCLFQSDIQSNYIRYTAAAFCYQSCGADDHITLPQNNQIIDIFNQTTQLMSQFAISFSVNLETIISYADISDVQFYAAYPFAYSVPNYIPNQRLWYINHVKKMQQYPENDLFFSPIYKLIHLKKYALSLTHTIYDLKKNQIGISQQMIPIEDENTIQDIPYNVLMLNQDGQIILNAANISINFSQIVYFFNESITGFNLTDWATVNDSVNGNLSFINQCDSYENTNCLFDKLNQKEIIFTTKLITEYNFILLIYTNITLDQQISSQMIGMQTKLSDELTQIAYIQLGSSFFVLVVSIIIAHQIFLPLKKLMNTINAHMIQLGNNLNSELFKLLNSRKNIKKNIFSDLTYELIKFSDVLNNRANFKNSICTQIENFQYNQKKIEQKCNISIEQLKNSDENDLNQQQILYFVKSLISEQLRDDEYQQ